MIMWQRSWALTGWLYDRDVQYPDGSSLYPAWAECVPAYPTCGTGEEKNIGVLRSALFKILHITIWEWEILHVFVCVYEKMVYVQIVPGDCTVYIRYDDFIIPFPQVDGSLTAACSLILSCHAKYHIIWTFLQLQVRLQIYTYTHNVIKSV